MVSWKSLAAVLVVVPAVAAADWPQFRGPNGGVVAKGKLPETWSKTENVAWTAVVPGTGWAQPVVVGNTVFVATAVTDPPFVPKNMMAGIAGMPKAGKGPAPGPDIKIDWQVVALDLATGKQKWAKTAATGKPKYAIHPSNSYATETPCADADRVYAFFGAAGAVVAFDHAGKEVWKKDVGRYPGTADLGVGASPALFGGTLFVPLLNEETATVLALDAKTGDEKFAIKREKPGTSWATPFVWQNAKRTELVVCGKGQVSGHDVKTGAQLWEFNNIDSSFSSSPAATDDVIAFGNGGPGSKSPLIFVKAGAKGDISLKDKETTNEFVVLYKTGSAPGMASPLAAGELVYILNNNRLTCYEAKSGAEKYKEQIAGLKTIAASPVLADGKLYVLDEAGKMAVVKAGLDFEVLHTNAIDDLFWTSPTPAGDKLLLRGVKGLYCVGKK
jgi:outer membrane protein assembly factor BamB